MGCLSSKPDNGKGPKERLGQSIPLSCLLFGLPDSGQIPFSIQMKKQFSQVGNFSTISYNFINIDSNREYREKWIEEFTKNPNVYLTYFFADISSNGSALLSIKTYNWLKSQMDDNIPIKIVCVIRKAKDTTILSFLQENLGKSDEIMTISESQPNDLAKFIDLISNLSEKMRIILNDKPKQQSQQQQQ